MLKVYKIPAEREFFLVSTVINISCAKKTSLTGGRKLYTRLNDGYCCNKNIFKNRLCVSSDSQVKAVEPSDVTMLNCRTDLCSAICQIQLYAVYSDGCA